MTRLYLRIYLGFLGILVLITMSAALLGSLLRGGDATSRPIVMGLAEVVAEALPADASSDAVRAQLGERSRELHMELALWDPERKPIAAVGARWPAPPPEPGGGPRVARWRRAGPPVLHVRLADGRWLGFRLPHRPEAHRAFLVSLLAVAGLVGIGAYPVARHIARRLEGVRAGMEKFGAGDLGARVAVEGRDEVAAVAHSFNEAADRVASLIEAERRMVASASHELRSPLARLRMALELVESQPNERWLREAERNVEELDALIDDLLLASRLDSAPAPRKDPIVDLAAIVTDECQRADLPCEVQPAELRGDAKALRRLVRNLLENALRYGGCDVEVSLAPAAEQQSAVLRVADRGPGVAPASRERIFEPFYRPAGHHEGDEGGVGLGLALARQVARYHGGDVSYEARPGGGSVFVASLPGRNH